MDSLASREQALSELPSSSASSRGWMPQIPEPFVPLFAVRRSSQLRCTCDLLPLRLHSVTNPDYLNAVFSTRLGIRFYRNCGHRNNSWTSKFFSGAKKLSTDSIPNENGTLKKDPGPPVETVRPLEAYVKETDELIKKLLAEIAEREMDTT